MTADPSSCPIQPTYPCSWGAGRLGPRISLTYRGYVAPVAPAVSP